MRNQIKFFVPFGAVFLLAGVGGFIGGVSIFLSGDRGVGALVALCFGFPFGAVGGFFFQKGVRLWRTVSRLQSSGFPVEGRVVEVALNRSVSVNDEHPWVLKCEWVHPKTGEKVRGESDFFWEDPEGRFAEGTPVTVLVDPEDPSAYWIDAEEKKGALRAA